MNITTINIQQSTNANERVLHNVLGEIYNTYTNPNFNSRGSIVKGNISVDYAYKQWVSELTSRWSNFKITPDAYYQDWDDLAFRSAISKLYGDGYGVTPTQLASAQRLAGGNGQNNTSPFWKNTEIEVIDLRPFTNLNASNWTSDLNNTSNFCRLLVVPSGEEVTKYKLKEIYVSSNQNGTNIGPNAFIASGSSSDASYELSKYWFEGYNNISASRDNILGVGASNYHRYHINHFYYLNHSEGVGRTDYRYSITIGDKTINYLRADNSWNYRGIKVDNLIVDSPIPMLWDINAFSWSNDCWRLTTLYVPNNQLADYVALYSNKNSTPKEIKSIDDYNITYRSMANWWVYEDKESFLFLD